MHSLKYRSFWSLVLGPDQHLDILCKNSACLQQNVYNKISAIVNYFSHTESTELSNPASEARPDHDDRPISPHGSLWCGELLPQIWNRHHTKLLAWLFVCVYVSLCWRVFGFWMHYFSRIQAHCALILIYKWESVQSILYVNQVTQQELISFYDMN